MRYIEPHAHMVSRVTDDYLDMVTAGCQAVCEPAFWAGYDRSSVNGFHDYFCQLTDYEPKRAAKFGLPHFCWLCINPKESEDVTLAARNAYLAMIDYLVHERGFNRQQAYAICSVAVDLAISEIVDVPNVVVSAFLPLDIFV